MHNVSSTSHAARAARLGCRHTQAAKLTRARATPRRRRGLVLPKGYDTYIKLFYALAAIILLSLLLAAYLALVLKKDDATEGGWTGK